MIEHYDGMSGHHILTMSEECADDCSRPGQDASDAVDHHLPHVEWHATESELRRICRETGAWNDYETADMETIKQRVLWMAANDWREEQFNNGQDRESYTDDQDRENYTTEED